MTQAVKVHSKWGSTYFRKVEIDGFGMVPLVQFAQDAYKAGLIDYKLFMRIHKGQTFSDDFAAELVGKMQHQYARIF